MGVAIVKGKLQEVQAVAVVKGKGCKRHILVL